MEESLEAEFNNLEIGVWRDDWVIKSMYCSYKGPEFSFQNLLGRLQPPITPAPGDPMPLTSEDTHTGVHPPYT